MRAAFSSTRMPSPRSPVSLRVLWPDMRTRLPRVVLCLLEIRIFPIRTLGRTPSSPASKSSHTTSCARCGWPSSTMPRMSHARIPEAVARKLPHVLSRATGWQTHHTHTASEQRKTSRSRQLSRKTRLASFTTLGICLARNGRKRFGVEATRLRPALQCNHGVAMRLDLRIRNASFPRT